MSDHKKINFSEDYEMNHILYNVLNKSKSAYNRTLLRKMGDYYKSKKNVTIITDREDFYKFVRNHENFDNFEPIK